MFASVCMCVCVRERERERESAGKAVSVCVGGRVGFPTRGIAGSRRKIVKERAGGKERGGSSHAIAAERSGWQR